MTENNFSRYLLYAVGEILLVVIGILIALQVNIWNTEKNNQQRVQQILNEMLDELQADEDQIESSLRRSKGKLEATEFLINYIDQNKPYHDSLDVIFGSTAGYNFFRPSTSSFELLKNFGFLHLENDSLKYQIQDLYSSTFTFISGMEDWREKYYFSVVAEFAVISFKDFNWWEESIPINGPELLRSKKFYNIISHQRTLARQEIRVYKSTLSEIEELKEMIENEYNSL